MTIDPIVYRTVTNNKCMPADRGDEMDVRELEKRIVYAFKRVEPEPYLREHNNWFNQYNYIKEILSDFARKMESNEYSKKTLQWVQRRREEPDGVRSIILTHLAYLETKSWEPTEATSKYMEKNFDLEHNLVVGNLFWLNERGLIESVGILEGRYNVYRLTHAGRIESKKLGGNE